ncbi:MAG: hypothetical protein ACK4EY_13350 [Flavipsychrobacter sp.]
MRKGTQGGETARHVNECGFVSSSYDGRSKGQRRRAQTRLRMTVLQALELPEREEGSNCKLCDS